MTGLYTAAQVRAAEEPLLASTPEGALMQRAATGLATVCLRLLDRGYGRRVVLLVGSGNNGGDALFAGALLARRGARVTAVLLDPGRAHARRARRAPPLRRARPAAGDGAAPGVIGRADLVLDGMLGIGGRGGLRPDAAALARAAADGTGITVAVDVPSGVDASTGAVEGAAFPAMHTVTFGAVKLGLVVGEGRGYAGQVAPRRHRPGPVPARPDLRPARRRRRRGPSRTPVGQRRQVLAGRRRHRRRIVDLPGCRRALHGRRAAHPARAGAVRRHRCRGRPRRLARGDRLVGPAVRRRPRAGLGGRPRHGHRRRRPQRAGRGAGHRPAGRPGRRRAHHGGGGAGAGPRPACPHRAHPARSRVRALRHAGRAGPGGGGPAAGRRSRRRRPAQGRRHGRRRPRRHRVRQRHRHPLAGHRRHRRRALRHRRRRAGHAGRHGPAHRRGRGGRRAPARPRRSAGRRAWTADRRRSRARCCPAAVSRVRGLRARGLGDWGT